MLKNIEVSNKKNSATFFIFLILSISLALMGLITLFSASYFFSDFKNGNAFAIINRQLFYYLVAVVAALIVFFIPLDFYKKKSVKVIIFVFTLILCFLPVFLSKEINGGKRWINLLGFSFQPSEFAKLSIVLCMAGYYSIENNFNNSNKIYGLVFPLFIIFIFCLPIFLQVDFSTTFFIFTLGFVIMFLGGDRPKAVAGLFILLITLGVIYLFLSGDFRSKRIMAYINPEKYKVEEGFQILQSYKAISNGKVLGVGLGNSVMKKYNFPERTSDFIFSVYSEETGFLGVLIFIVLYGAMVFFGFYTSYISFEDRFSYLLTFGISFSLSFQALLNLGVVCGLIPNTGITLPLFSSGGSSLLITCMMIGILLNASRKNYREVVKWI